MPRCKSVFLINPVIEQCEKKYIWGVEDRYAIKIFIELCNRRISIDGFIDEKSAGIRLFHRPVYSLKGIDKENAVILSLDIPDELNGYKICTDIYVVSPELYGKEVVVYGAGYIGQVLIPMLRDKAVNVIGFIDSDEKKVGTTILDIPVYGKEKLRVLSEETVVIEAGRFYKEIDKIVESVNENLDRFYVSELPYPYIQSSIKAICVDKGENIWLHLCHIATLMEHLGDREIILYGNNPSIAKKYAEIFQCLGFAVSIMINVREGREEDFPIIEDILYRDNYLILLYGKIDSYIINKLSDLGVMDKVRYVEFPFSERRQQWLDTNLGYTYEMNSIYPGIYVYGRNCSDDYKIVVLGGSTTDSGFTSEFRSWVEILYDQYCPENVTIFNGGICGYSSAEELIKLIRDMMKLNPDIVIVYDGFNDLNLASSNKFAYLKELIEFAGNHVKTSGLWDESVGKIWSGIPAKGDTIDEWLENIEYMHAIAECRNVKFFSFMQPSIYTKSNFNLHSYELWVNHNFIRMNLFQRFKLRAKEIEKTHSYIFDLTDIFDDVDVYMDSAHVYEDGNRIIADHIWNVIKNVIKPADTCGM